MATLAPNAAASQNDNFARCRSERESAISSALKLLNRANTLAMDAIAAIFTSSGK